MELLHHQNSLVMVKLLKTSCKCILELLGALSCCSLATGNGPVAPSPAGWCFPGGPGCRRVNLFPCRLY